MAKKGDNCKISAYTLALGIVEGNPELAKKLSDLSNQANEAALRHDALVEGAMQGIEGDIKQITHDQTLIEESADMKFRAVLFGGILSESAQGREALATIAEEIKNTGGTYAEGMQLYQLANNIDMSQLTEVAKLFTDGDIEKAKKLVDGIHKKLSNYVATDYSIVSSGSKSKLAKRQKELADQIDEAKKTIEEATQVTGDKQFKNLDKDLKTLDGVNSRTKAGKATVKKMAKRYGMDTESSVELRKKLTKIKQAKETIAESKSVVKTLEKEYKEAMDGDLRLIKDGKNPVDMMEGDLEWRFIKDFNADPVERASQYGQYVLSRVLLTGGKDLPQGVYDAIVASIKGATNAGVVNFLDEHLTEEWILDDSRTLEEILARAYTNAVDLVNDGQLRSIYRQKLIQLASDSEVAVKDADYIESLINTMTFAGAGAGFSDVLKYTDLYRTAQNLGINVRGTDGATLWRSIVKLFKREDFTSAISGDFVKLGNGTELTTRELLELVSNMLQNTNINKLIAGDILTDKDALTVMGKYLIGDAKQGGENLVKLLDTAKNAPSTNDTRGIVLKTITGWDVPSNVNVGFYDFRRKMKPTKTTKARADFQERLANANVMEIPNNQIPDVTDDLEREISKYKGGFILVNDAQWRLDSKLNKIINSINYKDGKLVDASERVQVIAPSGGFMGTVTMKDGKLVYRTSNTSNFNRMMRTIAIRSLGQTSVDTRFTEQLQERLLKGDIDALSEYGKLLEEDAKNYFGAMLGMDEEAIKNQLPSVLEDMTGISFKNYDSIVDKVEFWKRIDDKFILGKKITPMYDQEYVTVADVIKKVDSMSAEQMAGRFSEMFGYDVPVNQVTKDGAIKQEIRDAYLSYELSQSPVELLENKGRLLSLLNGGEGDNLSLDQLKSMFQSGDFSAYKDIFFHDLELSDEELEKHVKQINEMVFNTLSAQAAMNLTKMGYSLPLTNIRDFVYDILMGNINANGAFARAFLYKNGLPDTLSTLQGIANQIMPKELRFGWSDGYKYDVAHHGSWHLHTSFDMSKSGSGEGNFAHGIGVYVTRENPKMSSMYAGIVGERDKNEFKYKGKTRKDIAGDMKSLFDPIEDYVASNVLARMETTGAGFDGAVKAYKSYLEAEIDRLEQSLKDGYDEYLGVSISKSEEKEIREDIDFHKKCGEVLDTLDRKDFSYTLSELNEAPKYIGKNKSFKGKNRYELDGDLTLVMNGIWPESGENFFISYFLWQILNDLSFKKSWEAYRGLLGFDDAKRSAKIHTDTFYIDVKDNFGNAGEIGEKMRKLYNDALKFMEDITINDFDLPARGARGYFYKLEIPDYVRHGANTPTGASYIDDMVVIIRPYGEIVDDTLLKAVWAKLEELAASGTRLFTRGPKGTRGYEDFINFIKRQIRENARDLRHPELGFTEEDLQDIAIRLLGSSAEGAKKVSKIFSDLGYSGIEYTGGRDGRCRVIYNADDVQPLVIYDNIYKTPVWEKEGLDESKYVYTETKPNPREKYVKEDVDIYLRPIATDGDKIELSVVEESALDGVVDLVVSVYKLLKENNPYLGYKTFDEFIDQHIKTLEGYNNSSAKLDVKVFTYLKENPDWTKQLWDTIKRDVDPIVTEKNELRNFSEYSHFNRRGTGWGAVGDEVPDVRAENAIVVKELRNGRSVKEVADAYGVPINIVDALLTPEGIEAYGRYGNGIIDLVNNTKEVTAPHELFHAVFDMVDVKTKDKIIKKAKKLYGMEEDEAEEMLADKFSEYFRTGKFSLPKDQKTFKAQIKKFFDAVKKWLLGVKEYQGEVNKLFDDILDLKYAKNPDATIPDGISRFVEVKNQFVGDTYSSLIAMDAVKNGEVLPGAGKEYDRLAEILDKYYLAVSNAMNGGNLTFAEAQRLKIEAGYALDMFEQDYLYPTYRQFLTPQERNELFGMKYGLAIATSPEELSVLREYNENILNKFRKTVNGVVSKNDIIAQGLEGQSASIQKEIEKRQQQLLQQGATMKVIDGQVIVIDIREELFNELRNIPNNISGFENLKAMGRTGLEQLTNEEAYFLLNLVQLSKNMDTKLNMIMQTIYRVSPKLARLDFFNAYKVVDGVPQALSGNLMNSTEYLSKFANTEVFDTSVKKNILDSIKYEISKKGKLSVDALDEIIDNAMAVNTHQLATSVKGSELKEFKEKAKLIYSQAFAPYTYLQDIPKTVKDSIDNILAEQQKGLKDALALLGDKNQLTNILDNISIYTKDGEVKTIRQALDGEDTNIDKVLFDTDNEIIWSADMLAQEPTTPSMFNWSKSKKEKRNAAKVTEMQNMYADGLQAYLDEIEVVSKGERDLMNNLWSGTRQIAKKYTLTNKFVETDDALTSINDEIIRGMKTDILGFWGRITRGGQLVDYSGNINKSILKRWEQVQEKYKIYYSMSLDKLANVSAKPGIDSLALNLVKYFREMERRLGSIDGLKGVSTDMRINKAFAHIGEVVMNIDGMNGLYSLMSGIEGNQFLKFFRFSNKNQPSYVKEFVLGGEGKETIGGFRTYVDKGDEGLDKDWFNKTFGANFSNREYKKVVQALTGFTIINKKYKIFENLLNFINSSNYLTRVLLSYPGQLISIGFQGIAYFLKQKGWEKELGIEDLGKVDEIRKSTGILTGSYNEINLPAAIKRLFNRTVGDELNPFSYYNRYGLPDVDDIYKKQKFYNTDDLNTLYSKIDEYGAGLTWGDRFDDLWTRFIRSTDAYKDNANNIIDGLFSRNFKNISFQRALQSNNVMKFATAEQFANFMSSEVPSAFKKRVMDAVTAESGRNFRNILGLGFSGLDRAIGGGALSNLFVGIFQLLNFRGAWGMNIARQTNNFFVSALRMGRQGLSKEALDNAALYMAKTPEFSNFITQLFVDLKNSWRLARYQDNGQIPPENEEWSFMDFVEFAAKNMEFASQWWQGIQSYGVTRVGTAMAESALQSHLDPEIYKDTYGIGAFFNALAKNAGRNWKVRKLIANSIATAASNNPAAGWEYLKNEFWKLSFGTLRYLMNEDETSYGFSMEMPSKKVGIPFIITGEADDAGDKAFSYDMAATETWENLTNWYEAVQLGDSQAAAAYKWNMIDSIFNSSQMLGTIKGYGKALNGLIDNEAVSEILNDWHLYEMGNPYDADEAGEIISKTDAGAAMFKNGYYIPENANDVQTFVDTIIGQSDYRPGNVGFNKSFFNFDKDGHMKSLKESNEKDAGMEMLLTNMKYKRDEKWNFVLDEDGQKIVTDYWKNHMYDIEHMGHDEDYLVKANFNFINNWVEANNTDPNYMLYKRLIGEGLAGAYLSDEADKYVSGYNITGGYKKTKKKTLTELKNEEYYDGFITSLTTAKTSIGGEYVPFLEALASLDKAALMEADMKIIENQLNRAGLPDVMKKYFRTDDEGQLHLTTKLESYIEEEAKLSKYLRDGDLDRFMAETTSLTDMFKKSDPYGLMTTSLISSRINRINQSDTLSAEQKSAAINVLMTDNYEFIQQHIPEFIDELGPRAEAYISQMNEYLYGDSMIADNLVQDTEKDNSKSGRSSAINASELAKKLMGKLASSSGDGQNVGPKKYTYNYIPVKLDGAKLLQVTGSKGYTPDTADVKVVSYKPHTSFALKKDINRSVNGPKTQPVTKKKLLSKLESDATKAIEAES